VGATQAHTVQTRVIAATHRDLEGLMGEGRFREDLFYRLNVIALELPPLRARREDISVLAEHFLAQFARRQGRRLRLGAGALDRLLAYAWPGNVRELENAMERTAILSQDDVVTAEDLPRHVAHPGAPPTRPAPGPPQTLAEAERAHILDTLERCGWSYSRAAEALGIGRTTLWRKLKDYGLER
jgi:DNA-binding NtrC family response regulator